MKTFEKNVFLETNEDYNRFHVLLYNRHVTILNFDNECKKLCLNNLYILEYEIKK